MSKLPPEDKAAYREAQERMYEALANAARWMAAAGVPQEHVQADLEEWVSTAVEAAYEE